MQRPQPAVRILALAFLLFLSACGGGGGGGADNGNVFALNGGSVSGAVSFTVPLQTYTFNAEADTAYIVSAVTGAGDIIITVYNGSPTGGSLIGYSWNDLAITPLNAVSFIADFTGPVTIVVQHATIASSESNYTLQAVTGDLAIGTPRTGSTYNERIYYSFEAQSGTAYQVRLAPQSGNADIGSVNAKNSASVGSSLLSGASADIVTFLAPATQRYYVHAYPASVDTTFEVQVSTTATDPDLRVVVNSAVSDGTNVAVNYTAYNNGLSSAAQFGVTAWSNAASAPTTGSSGEASATHASLASGASATGTLVIPNVANSGTAYAIVDTVNAVAETNEANNVSLGVAWQKPLTAPQSFNFESGPIPTAMTMSGNAAWAIDATTGGAASTHSLKAGTIGNSQSSCVAMSVANGLSISFDYTVSSEASYDYLRFYIDGVQSRSWSGTVAWSSTGAIPVTSGVHEYKWCYAKDFAFIAGSDTAWIDNIVVTAAPPPTVDLQVAINSAVSNGSSVTVNYTVSNLGNSASGPFNVDVWSNNGIVPSVGATGQGTATHASLAAGASVTGSVTIIDANASGTAYAIADTQNSVTETSEINNVTVGYPWLVAIDLQVVINSAVSDRSNVTVNYTVSNLAANAAGPFNVDVWSSSASAPAVGTTGLSTAAHASLLPGASVTRSVTIADTSASGTAYAIVDTLDTVGEGIETNNVSLGKPWQRPPLAPLSFNFNDGLLPADMVMSGNAAWAPATSGKGNNTIFILKAGTITDGQTTCVAVSAAMSSSVSFDYSVSSESGFDYLRFYIDGVQKGAWSGAVVWTASGLIAAGTTGLHVYKWCYEKDGVISSGSDTAWIDNIAIN